MVNHMLKQKIITRQIIFEAFIQYIPQKFKYLEFAKINDFENENESPLFHFFCGTNIFSHDDERTFITNTPMSEINQDEIEMNLDKLTTLTRNRYLLKFFHSRC